MITCFLRPWGLNFTHLCESTESKFWFLNVYSFMLKIFLALPQNLQMLIMLGLPAVVQGNIFLSLIQD